jgi:hypothetical protein
MPPIEMFHFNPDQTIKQHQFFPEGTSGEMRITRKGVSATCQGEENGGIVIFKDADKHRTILNLTDGSTVEYKNLGVKIIATNSTDQNTLPSRQTPEK